MRKRSSADFGKFRKWIGYGSCVGLFAVGAMAAPSTRVAAPKKTIDFNRDVRPIITKCFTCHGHDPKTVAAGLRLDDGPSAKKMLDSGATAIVPFHPEQSELINRVFAKPDAPFLMPPKSSNKILSAEDKEILKRWIAEGAEYKEHWAFVAPVRPALPTVKDVAWVKNPIDQFILEQVEAKGLKPSPEADRPTLIRRVTLDLTGLPPTPKEVDAFVNDKSANPYEKVVDRLLASPRYGERMAMDWMDYSRYADSNGYQADFERYQWRWRDWVINAFNNNMPYDRFTVEQIAGDMLPNATMDQKLATGFNRNHRINTEGGVVAEEWRVETVIDRVETTSAVWLGLTTGCARCHDHKYDPLTQKEFYQLFAFFNNVPESGTGEERPVNHPPFIKAPTPEQSLQMKVLERSVARLDGEEAKFPRPDDAKVADWKVADPAAAVTDGLVARYKFTADAANFKAEGGPAFLSGRSTGSVATKKDAYLDLGNIGDFDVNQPFSYGAWLNPAMRDGSPIARMDAGKDYRGWDLFLNGDRPAAHLIDKWPMNAIKAISKTAIPIGQWSHVLVTYDGSGKKEGVHIYVNGKSADLDYEGSGKIEGTIRTDVTTKIGRRTNESGYTGQVDDFAVYQRALTADDAKKLAATSPASQILGIAPEKRTDEQKKELTRLWMLDHDEKFRALDAGLSKDKDERQKLDADISTVMVMEEMPKPREAHILVRGQYDHPGDAVQANLPSFLAIKGKSFPNNRLGLARWIVDPSNPLTARVTVNRFWERLFGSGIVSTVEDFGTRADFPSHPELLDWLATDLIAKKWNLKATLKQMVMSATYRQSSTVTALGLKLDPTNRLFARGPRFRLPAEVIRDQAMFAGGMLQEKTGGPSVRPYQPDGVWDDVNVYGNLRNYKHDMGPGLHRRSLYTIWKRTAAPPTMTLFDVPSREICRVVRARTDTPLQALTLMNDVTYVEAARALAQRMLKEGGSTPESRLRFAFRTILAREPDTDEMRALSAGLSRRMEHYRTNLAAAKKLIAEGDLPVDPKIDPSTLAAYTLTASIILNLDETINKE